MLVVMLKLFPRVSWAEGTAVTVKKMQKKKKKKKRFYISLREEDEWHSSHYWRKTASNVNGQSTSVQE